MSVDVVAVSAVDDRVLTLMDAAFNSAREHRGGQQLLDDVASVLGVDGPSACAHALVAANALVGVYANNELQGFAALSLQGPPLIMAIFIDPGSRRDHLAKKLLRELQRRDPAPRDAWVLPGDRATKSLYEKITWKARRLTMSAE